MSNVDPNIERLIVRRLDGELTPDEQLELDRVLLKCPEARALLEEYERIDGLASAAVASVVADDREMPARSEPLGQQQPAHGYSRAWWALPAAVAAAIALAALLGVPDVKGPQLVEQPPSAPPKLAQSAVNSVPTTDGLGPVQHAAYGSTVNRATDTTTYYIVGPDGNIYVLEQQRVRTARAPNAGIRPASGDL
jgi:anti-sigma factor RsiW